MTPNGAVVFGLALVAGAIAAPGPAGLGAVAAVCTAFAVVEVGAASLRALWRSTVIVLPLAGFMAIVWIGIVGRAPAEIAAGLPGSRPAATAYVGFVLARLFLIAVAVQLVILRFAGTTPLSFVRRLTLPLGAKRLLVLTLSLADTLVHAVDRARTAAIAAGVITRRPSLRNLTHAWVLVQTVWLTAVTIALGRMRDKWPVERTLTLLDGVLQRDGAASLGGIDAVWIAAALAGLAAVAGLA